MAETFRLSRLFAVVAAILLTLGAASASAAVKITFYTKELGTSFPHAFVTMEGALDRNGERINADYGFSAKTVTPAILMGRVRGEVISNHGAPYIKSSDRHFALTLSDAEYDRVMALIGKWRSWPQPSYDLGSHNCIHFVAEVAGTLGMLSDVPKNLTKKPRSFLQHLTRMNHPWLVAHNAVFYGQEAAP